MTQRLMIRKSKFSLQKSWPWMLTLAMVGLLVALVVLSSGWRERKLIKHFEEELMTASEANVPAIIDQIAEFGDEGIKPLVKATNSQREVVSQNARHKLNELFASWERLPSDLATKKIAILAQSFATEVRQFGPTAKNTAADFAERILLLKTDSRIVSRTELISHCDTILRNVSTNIPAVNQFVSDRSTPTNYATERTATQRNRTELNFSASLKPLPNLAGGGIPIEPIKNPTQFGLSEDPQQPDLLQTPTNALPLESSNTNIGKEPLQINPNRLRPKRFTDDFDSSRVPSRFQEYQEPPPYAELITQIQSTDKKIAAAATEKLEQLGFDRYRLAIGWEMRHPNAKTQLVLLKQATHAQSSVRKRLARTLTRAVGMEIWPWLIWLSLDLDEEVRREAIVQMESVDRKEVKKRLQEVVEQESDDSIKILAERILQRQKR